MPGSSCKHEILRHCPLLLPCRITVKSLNERTDLQALAAEVVDKCKLIHPSKVWSSSSATLLQVLLLVD